MKKITKSLMTLALLAMGVTASAEERVIAEIDYSQEADREISKNDPEGSTVSIIDGLFTIDNQKTDGNAWDLQPAILEGFNVKQGYSYKIIVNYKSTKAGNINFTWGDWNGNSGASYGVGIIASDEFSDFQQQYNNVGFSVTGNAGHVLWQCRGINGTMYIKKVTVIEIVPDVPTTPEASISYGDLKEAINNDLENGEVDGYYLKNYGESEHALTTAEIDLDPDDENNHVVKVHSMGTGDPWSAQFWVVLPYALPKGQTVKVTFDYKADKAATSSTQGHTNPGSYLNGGTGLGTLTYSTDWKTYSETLTINAGDQKSFAVNLADFKEENNYYFDNLVVEVPEQVSAFSIGVKEEGWATVSYSEPFKVGEGEGFAATYNGVGVTLTPVTNVPANTGIVIKGTEGTAKTLTFQVIDSAEGFDNDLKVSDGTVTGEAGNIYALSKGDQGVGFYKVASDVVIPEGKAYMVIEEAAGREFIGFGGEATGINVAKTVKADGAIFNLAGQRVVKAQKGLYIQNGKKYLVK